ncbi:MAG TPA: hypothetical protein VE981_15545 [Planctomycetota bacterium]|nr:hypothetical protein [Planctomycetota bacterium]
MHTEPQPKDVLAKVEEGGVRYELANTTDPEQVFVTCVEPGGAIRWRRSLNTVVTVACTGEMRLERQGVVAMARGYNRRFPDRKNEARVYMISRKGEVLESGDEYPPVKILAFLEHGGLRYEMATSRFSSFGILTCLGPGGVVHWRRQLSQGSVELEEAKLEIDAGQLAVDAFGSHSKGGEWCVNVFRVTLDGEVVREDPFKFVK